MKILRFAFLAVLAVLFTGCATVQEREPVIDTKGVDMNRYASDLADCRQLAGRVDPGSNAAGNAVAGAVVGGIIGAIFGGRHGAAQLAGVGAVAGGTGGAANSFYMQRAILGNCMTGRGYRVLAY